jgi:oligo-1,6-glucosidase
VYPSPQDDNGYDISDYRDIDPVFGTLAQFDELLAGLHERGIKLVMDLVVNHTSDEHPWFLSRGRARTAPSATGTGGARRARGTRRASRGRADELGLVLLRAGVGARPGLGRVLPAPVLAQQPDLNWENPEVRAAVYEMMNWWLDRGVDGFRMDVINMISKDPACPTASGRRASRTGTARRTSSPGRASTSSCRRCTGRSSPAATPSC